MTEGFFSDPADTETGQPAVVQHSECPACHVTQLGPSLTGCGHPYHRTGDGVVLNWDGPDGEPGDAMTESGPLNRAEAVNWLVRAGRDFREVDTALSEASACGSTGRLVPLGPHRIIFLATTGRWYVDSPAGQVPVPSSAVRYRDRWLALIRDAAGNLALGDSEVGGRIRALLYPAHIHVEDGTVEGCPGCFPPAEVIPDPVADARKASMAAFEEAARYWPDLSGEYNVLEILVALRLVDAALDAFAPDIYQGADPVSRLLNRWRRIAAGPASEGQEAVDALNLATGGNPRKGVIGDDETVLGELGDTVVASLLAIQSVTKDTDATWSVFIEALAKAVARVPAPRPAGPEPVLESIADYYQPPVPARVDEAPGRPPGYCRDCWNSGVGACDAFPDCPNGRNQQEQRS